jgi:dipeptidyl aminopeptidase/acylaminoacyl peptidase
MGTRHRDGGLTMTPTCGIGAVLAVTSLPLLLLGLAGGGGVRAADGTSQAAPTMQSQPLAAEAATEWGEPADVTFRSGADGTEQKYVELLPKGFDETQEHHLVIALHGLFADRWQYIRDGRGECAGSRQVALRHGMIYVSPDYRATGSWMNAAAEADVVQIVAEQRKKHRIGRVILTGASMGGTSVLIFTALHPDLVDGVCSENGTANMMEYKNFLDTVEKAYGGPQAEKPEECRKRSPELTPEKFTKPIAFTAGGQDTSVPPQSVLRLAEAVKKTNPKVLVLYRENVGHETDLKDTVEAMEFVVGAAIEKK